MLYFRVVEMHSEFANALSHLFYYYFVVFKVAESTALF